MKYFIVSVDGNYVPPAAIGWYGVIDRMTLHKKKAYEVQKHLLFLIETADICGQIISFTGMARIK